MSVFWQGTFLGQALFCKAMSEARVPLLTTDQIQKMLEENYSVLKTLVDQQNLGRPEEQEKWGGMHGGDATHRACTAISVV